jgi:hypothetical protein
MRLTSESSLILLGSEDYIRCLFMLTMVGWLMPRMGCGLACELACHDEALRTHAGDTMRLGWMCDERWGWV